MQSELLKLGWILSESGLKQVESKDLKNAIKILLDRDLREVGAGIGDLHKGKFESLDHDLAVLQLLKTRNISAPKANEESKTAPKLLKLILTDGVNTYSAIEMESTPLTMDTKPGTKIQLKVKLLKMANNQLLLTPKNMEILGGHVEHLVSKWEVSRSLAGIKGSRFGTAGGPPAFIPFGQKIQQNITNDRGFKSLVPAKQKENENGNSDFNAQRKDAIAEASKAGTKKTFGGGSKILVDSNVQKIMDKGYTEEEAMFALKLTKNNVERALGNLKRRDERQQRSNSNEYEPRENPRDRRGGKGASAEPASAKPSGKVSLFDFLEDKIPTSHENSSNAKQSSSYSNNERFENNISSSFRKHDKDVTNNKSQNWAQQSSGGYESKSSQNFKQSNSNSYTREYRDNGRDQPRDYRNNRDSRDLQRDTREGRDSKYQQSNNNYSSKPNATSQYQQKPSMPSQKSSTANNGSNYNNREYQDSSSKSKFNQKPEYNGKSSGQQKDYNNYGSSMGRNDNYSSNKPRSSTNNNTTSSKYYSDYQSDSYQKSNRDVVESMEKMNLKGNQYKSGDSKGISNNSSAYPPLTSSAESSKPNYGNKSNFPIVGFQNKEANEHAKNALKTKNIPNNQSQPKQQPNWQQQAPPVTVQKSHSMPVQVISQQAIKNQPPPPFPVSAPVQQQQAPPVHSLPQPFVQHQVMHPLPPPGILQPNPNSAVFHPTPINYPTPIMMQSVQQTNMGSRPTLNQLKIGDLCLAKYWEDGQFYSAKITGISDSTYVVLFTEYGNAEEVRKPDCVPLIAACPTPPHSQPMTNFVTSAHGGSYRITSQKQPTHYQAQNAVKNQQRRN